MLNVQNQELLLSLLMVLSNKTYTRSGTEMGTINIVTTLSEGMYNFTTSATDTLGNVSVTSPLYL